jgi:hypothetical protein
MVIRPFTPLDIWLARRLVKRGEVLDLGRSLLASYDPLMPAVTSYIPYGDHEAMTYLVETKGDGRVHRGLIQALARPDEAEWVVAYMAPALSQRPENVQLWADMLTLLCKRGAERGVLRLFAKSSSEAEEAFQQANFSAYAQEHLFRLKGFPDSGEVASSPLRSEKEEDDGDRVRLLYERLTPGPVRSLVGLDGVLGELDSAADGIWEERYVLEGKDEILGHLRLRGGKAGYLVKAALRPDALDQADQFLNAGLALLASRPPRAIYCSVVGYQGSISPALERLGFVPLATQTLWVRHTAVRVEERAFQVVRGLEKGVEPARTTLGR